MDERLILMFSRKHRQRIRRDQSTLAAEVMPVPAGPAEERGGQRGYQGLGHVESDRQAHPGEPGAQAEEKDVQGSWAGESFLPFPSLLPSTLF